MRDLMELSYEISQLADDDKERQEMFTEEFLKELAKEKGADVAPRLSCVFDASKCEYRVTLTFPCIPGKPYPCGCDVE